MTDHLALQACQNKLDAEDHQEDPNEEQRLVTNLLTHKDAASHDKTVNQNTNKECPESERAKEPQRSAQERGKEEYIEQVDQATSETPGAELGDAVETRMVTHFDLCDAEATPVSHDGYKAVEFTIEFEVYIVDNFTAIGFEAVVDIMQVDTGQGADHAVKDAGREGFRDGIEAREFPAGNEIVAFVELCQEIGVGQIIFQIRWRYSVLRSLQEQRMIWQPVALLTLAQKSILLVRLYALVVFLSAAYLMFSTARLLR